MLESTFWKEIARFASPNFSEANAEWNCSLSIHLNRQGEVQESKLSISRRSLWDAKLTLLSELQLLNPGDSMSSTESESQFDHVKCKIQTLQFV
jgi:hypothetical protein